MIRRHFQVIGKRIEDEPRRFIQVIYGPRQVGKMLIGQEGMPWEEFLLINPKELL